MVLLCTHFHSLLLIATYLFSREAMMELHEIRGMETGSQAEEKPVLAASGVAKEGPEDEVLANPITGDQ